jgi:hypothetical protein
MRRLIVASALCLLCSQALAGSGAVAYDQASGHYGFAWNEPSPVVAAQITIRDCASNCRIFPVAPGQCAALATSADPQRSTAWGLSMRSAKADAEQSALQDCQRHTVGGCLVRGSMCNTPGFTNSVPVQSAPASPVPVRPSPSVNGTACERYPNLCN